MIEKGIKNKKKEKGNYASKITTKKTPIFFLKEQKKPKRFNTTTQWKVLTRSEKQNKLWIDKNLLLYKELSYYDHIHIVILVLFFTIANYYTKKSYFDTSLLTK